MPPKESASTKRGAGPGSTSDIDTILPLFFAAHPEVRPNYKKMSAIDEHNRTPAALEHKFRIWRHKAKEIAAKYPEECATKELVGEPAKTKTPRTPKKSDAAESEDKDAEAGENGDCTPTRLKGKKRAATAKANGTPRAKKRVPVAGVCTVGEIKKEAKTGDESVASEATLADEESDEFVPKHEEEDAPGSLVQMEFA